AAEVTLATSINNAGQIVGYYIDSTGQQHGFLYSSGTYTTIDDPSATSGTAAFGINDGGDVVGFYTPSTGQHGFLQTTTPPPNPPPPPGTTAFMIMSSPNNRAYDIFDIANNPLLRSYLLGQL